VVGVGVWLDGKNSQRGRGGVYLPARFERLNGLDLILVVGNDVTVIEREDVMGCGIADGDGDVGIVVVKVGKAAAQLLE